MIIYNREYDRAFQFKIKERIVKLRQKIAELQEEYHVYDNPSVSDEVMILCLEN
jgi:hypothetical protein